MWRVPRPRPSPAWISSAGVRASWSSRPSRRAAWRRAGRPGSRHCSRQATAFAFFDRLNRFYVAQEEAALAARFPPEPAPWDRVQHLWDFGRAPERADHPDHMLAKVLQSGFLRRPAVARARPARAAGGQRAGGDEGGRIRPSRRKVADRARRNCRARLRWAAISRICSTPTRCAPRSVASPAPMTAGTSWSEGAEQHGRPFCCPGNIQLLSQLAAKGDNGDIAAAIAPARAAGASAGER